MTTYIPFGKHCGPANILKQSGLRIESLPFDWLFAFPEYIRDSFDTDFEKWFDLASLKCLVRKGGYVQTDSLHYPIVIPEATDVLTFFNHHNLTDLSVQETFKRRIKRLRDILSSDEHVVFLTTATQSEMEQNGLLDYFNRDAKTDFVFLDWKNKQGNHVSTYIDNGYLTIEYACESHLSNPIVSKAIGDILSSLD